MSPSAAPSMPINICLSISHEFNGFVCQMEAKDGMAFFLNFLFFHQFFLCKVFGKRVGGFRKTVVLEKTLNVKADRVVFATEKFWD